MKFSTETVKQIEQIIVADFANQLEAEHIKSGELEQALRCSFQEIARSSYGKMLSLLDEHKHGIEAICECGEKGKRVSRREAQVLSVFGWSDYHRSYYKCGCCGHRWVALDETQELRAGQATPLMSSLLALSGITVSFEEAQSQIKQYLAVEVSANTIRQETQLIGEKQVEREEKWITQSQDLDFLQERERLPEGPKRLYGSIDGAFAPIEKEWREIKTVCWYQTGSRYGNEELHAQDIAYYSSLEKADSFGELFWGTGVHHHADQAEELIFVCDGASWIWKQVEKFFPEAVQIVDWYHANQYLYAVAEALSVSEEEQKNWYVDMKKLLWKGQIEAIIQKCRTLLDQVGEPARRLISYYSNNIERMRYKNFRDKNYLIGSGTVESACKQIVTMRLKRSGARWTEAGAKLTAKARSAWLSGTWQALTLPLAA
jgi:hypothetical protein